MTQEESHEVKPLHDSIAVLFLILGVAMVATPLVVRAVASFIPALAGTPVFVIVGLLLQQGVLLALALWRLRALGTSWNGLRPYIERFSQLGTAIWWGLGLLFLNGFLAQLSAGLLSRVLGEGIAESLLHREQAAVERLLSPELGGWYLGAIVFLAVGVAPLVEEVFFRGYAYPVLKSYTPQHAAWMSALLFAGVHLYVINFIPIFVLGIILARMYERTGSLAMPIVAHATINACVAVIAVVMRNV